MSSKGFTLVELVVVVILIGILSVFAAPRLFSRSDFEPYAVRDQLIAALRQVQLMQMQDGNNCFRLRATKQKFVMQSRPRTGSADDCSSGKGFADYSEPATHEQSVEMVGKNNPERFSVRYDSQYGRPVSPGPCNLSTCQMTINTVASVDVCIEAEGYIHAC